jgi:hypothetical protein
MTMVEEQRRRQIMARQHDRGLLEQNIAARQALTRRNMLAGAATLAAAGGLGAVALPGATLAADTGSDTLGGLWHDVISAADHSFPPFEALEIYGGGICIGSGNTDLSPASLYSSLWGIWERTGPHTFRVTGKFWTYTPKATPSGIAAVSYALTVSADGNAFQGKGPVQYFDTKGKALGAPTPLLFNATRITFS